MNNKGQKGGLGWPVVVLIVAALFLFYPQISNMLGGTPASTETTTTEETDVGFICPVDTTQLSFAAEDVDNPGTNRGVLARYWVEGLPRDTTNVTGDAVTVSPDDELEVWFGAGSTEYYGNYYDGDAKVPCKGTYTVSGDLWQKSTGVTMTVFDEFDNPQSGAENNQTLGIGETVEMKLRVKGEHEKYFGNPEVDLNNVLTAEYSRTELDSVKVTKDGVELASANVPVAEDLDNVANTEIGFSMPKIAGSANVDYYIIIKADDILNPSEDITLKIYDADYFYNQNTGKIGFGHEDEDNQDIGIAQVDQPSATVYLD